MTTTEARGSRTLIGDWEPPKKVEQTSNSSNCLLVEGEEKPAVKAYRDSYGDGSGVLYQQCGGGRRVIRKRIPS